MILELKMSTRPDLKFSDAGDERKYYSTYSKLPPQNESTIRVIDHNNLDYFTCLGTDADLIAENIYKTQSVMKFNNSNQHRYVTISPQVFLNNVLKFVIIDKHLKIEIYNSKTFELIATGTAGNLEKISVHYSVNLEGMFQDCSNPIVGALKMKGRKLGLSLVDLSNSTIQLSEFEDNELCLNLESLLLQLGVKEVVVPSTYISDDDEYAKLFQVLNKVNVVVSTIKASFFGVENIEQDLGTILKDDKEVELVLSSKNINSIDFGLSLGCTSALISYLELLSESSAFSIERYDLSSFMKLDSATMRALNVFPATSTTPGVASSSITSIFSLLNKCKTAPGSRLLSQWLKQPLTSLTSIQERQDLVGMLIDDAKLRVFLTNDWLVKVPDLKRLMKKISISLKKSLGNENKKLDDVIRLYQMVLVMPDLIEILEDTEEHKDLISTHWLSPLKTHHASLVNFQQLIETTIDLSPLESSTGDLNNDFNIKPEFDDSLVEINDRLQDTKRSIKKLHQAVGEDLNIEIDKKLKLEQHVQHGWCFRVTRNDSVVLRNTDKTYNQLQTVKAGVFFSSPGLDALSKKYNKVNQEFNVKQRELIKEILSITLTYQLVFLKLSMILSHLDVVNSFANAALLAPTTFVKPNLQPMSDSNDREIKLPESRHPLLEVQDDVSFIPNDLDLSKKSFAIITGPNMGGKSTFIRQIGVISLMSQIGSFIPSSADNRVPIFDAILSRVGSGDSQLKGLSTFMIEMLETSSILATSTRNSLIIIDELGRGTSTYDGFGLAWSILEHLIKEKKCFTLFATHFHELTKLSQIYETVENLHVVAHVEEKDDITLMYKVERGISDKSFGIHVAEMVKFPLKIVQMAKRKAAELQQDEELENKKSRLSLEEVKVGTDLLKGVLKKWRQECYDGEKLNCSSDEAIRTLKEMTTSEDIRSDKFVGEILEML